MFSARFFPLTVLCSYLSQQLLASPNRSSRPTQRLDKADYFRPFYGQPLRKNTPSYPCSCGRRVLVVDFVQVYYRQHVTSPSITPISASKFQTTCTIRSQRRTLVNTFQRQSPSPIVCCLSPLALACIVSLLVQHASRPAAHAIVLDKGALSRHLTFVWSSAISPFCNKFSSHHAQDS